MSTQTLFTCFIEIFIISKQEMKNYCRAIRVAGESDTPREPWCYTSTGKEPCNVPRCSEIMFRSEYRLAIAITVTV